MMHYHDDFPISVCPSPNCHDTLHCFNGWYLYVVYVFHNDVISSSYAPSLDQPYYPGDADQQCVLDGQLDRCISQNTMGAIPSFKEAYGAAVACAHCTALFQLPFLAVISRLGASVPSTVFCLPVFSCDLPYVRTWSLFQHADFCD
jgi:hypothetical protein